MLKATDGLLLPTTIIGSLPRPSWYTENLGTRSFLDAMVDIGFREQYVDALSVYLREQELAGLDVVTDGDCRFDHDVGGQSWTRYPTQHMSGFERISRSWPRRAPEVSPSRGATSSTTTSRLASCRGSSGRSAAGSSSTPRCGRRRSA